MFGPTTRPAAVLLGDRDGFNGFAVTWPTTT
jgi:hypothetical protein